MPTASVPTDQSPPTGERAPAAGSDRRPRWVAPAVVAAALLVIVVAGVFGIRGLLANPVKGTDSSGITTVEGSFDPFDCSGSGCTAEGYVSAGGRKVFVIFPGGCAAPPRDASVTVRARQDPSQGRQTYRALDCGSH